jgi:hypothetical protein
VAYSSSCLCGQIKFEFELDPMLQFQCHCSTCFKVFGTSMSGLTMPEHEINVDGEMSVFTIVGGSGNDMHYYFCSNCSTIIYNKPELLGGMAYVLAGAFIDQIDFRPTLELWTGGRPDWIPKAPSIIESFDDNGTVERIQKLLENLDQRE